MAPSTTLEMRPEPEVLSHKDVTSLVLDRPHAPLRNPAEQVKPVAISGNFLKSAMIENNRVKSSSKILDILISFTVNAAILAGPVVIGLVYTDTLNLKQYESTFLIAPPPPPPPPPAAAAVVRAAPAHRTFESAGKLIAPTVVPKNVAMLKEEPLTPDADGGGIPGGVPGGVAGGSMGGVIGGVIGGVSTSVPIAPMAPKEHAPKVPVRVGGRVKAPRLVYRVAPTYPPLARQTHTQGVVIIDAVVDEQGNVVEARVTSGAPLLMQAALDAVRKWRYEPTYLNDEPVPVQLNVTVTFELNN